MPGRSMLRKAWGWAAPLAVLAVAVLVFVLLAWSRPEPPAEEPAEPSWVVATQRAEPSAHQPLLRLFGYVESPSTATLKAAVAADVVEVSARDGRTVAEDERLVRLDDEELQDTLRQRQAELAEQEAALAQERRAVAADREDLEAEEALLAIEQRRVERLRELRSDGSASSSELDDAEAARERQRQTVIRAREAVDNAEQRLAAAEARRDAAEAARDQAQRDVRRTEIRAPFTGRISGVEVGPGDRVRSGDALVELYDTGKLEIRVQVPTTRIGALQRVRAAGAEVSGQAHVDGETLTLTLDRLSGRSQREQGGIEALFRIQGRHDGVAIGRFAEVMVALPPEPDSLVIPYEALYGSDRIYRVETGEQGDERLRGVTVERLGEARLPDGRRGALIRAPGLEPGSEIVTTQIPQATDGLRVQVQEEGR
ncbi:MAG: efflux RND transporter periplasmic adaptor subunit [Halorhodospira sp.]